MTFNILLYRIPHLMTTITILTFLNALPLIAQDSKIIADRAELTLIFDRFSFTEGPATDEDGNVTFIGPDQRTLFITASHSVYTLEMNVQGR